MTTGITCPKCGGTTSSEQINYRLRAYCKHCGGLPYRDGRPETGRGHVHAFEPVKSVESAA